MSLTSSKLGERRYQNVGRQHSQPKPGEIKVSLQRSLGYHDFIAAPYSDVRNTQKTMFENLFRGKKGISSDSPEELAPKERMRAIVGSSSAELAAQLLIAPTALMQLTREEAFKVVSYMTPRKIAEGTTFINEGDDTDTAFMLLLLEGEVTVENIVVSRHTPVTVTVLGPGSLIGEMGLVDGLARLASCTATTDARCAVLSRPALERLAKQDPQTATKLMSAIALRIAERLRDTSEKLKMYTQLVQAMQQEIDHLMPG